MNQVLKCGRFDLDIGANRRPLVMGILNVTPDSFSDGGQFDHLDRALSHADAMLGAGVDIIDIGGESSRPGAPPVSLEQELARIMPVLYALRDCGKPISIDTYKPQVMREALAAGADFINDIKGFQEATALDAVKDADCGLCIMHMQSDPLTMQLSPHYDDILDEVVEFLLRRAEALAAEGIERDRLWVDPGFGFGKTLVHNVTLLQNLRAIGERTGLPVLAGMSRKSMIGSLTGRPAGGRVIGSVAAALVAVERGSRMVRVHDVAETIDALTVWHALRETVAL
ncbi:MAG: dihydropteroate synthase [Herminiimonas sp.]|nr:dihydropteroate synthase [Herminiimonas sp.]